MLVNEGIGEGRVLYLLVDITGILPAVLVEQVERVARELHAAGLRALAEEGVLGACFNRISLIYISDPRYLPVAVAGAGGDVRVTCQMRSALMFSYSFDMLAVAVAVGM